MDRTGLGSCDLHNQWSINDLHNCALYSDLELDGSRSLRERKDKYKVDLLNPSGSFHRSILGTHQSSLWFLIGLHHSWELHCLFILASGWLWFRVENNSGLYVRFESCNNARIKAEIQNMLLLFLLSEIARNKWRTNSIWKERYETPG